MRQSASHQTDQIPRKGNRASPGGAPTPPDTSGVTYEELVQKRDDIHTIAARYGAYNLRVFGSVARGDAVASSDIDIVAQFEPGRTLFDHGGLIMDLQEFLGVKVDVISEAGIRPRSRKQLLQEALPL